MKNKKPKRRIHNRRPIKVLGLKLWPAPAYTPKTKRLTQKFKQGSA